MAIDSEGKRRAAIDAGLPWKFPTIDPTATGFDAGDRGSALGLYGFDDTGTATLVDPSLSTYGPGKYVYGTATSANNAWTEANAISYVEGLSPDSSFSTWDFSGTSILYWSEDGIGTTGIYWTNSLPCTLITSTHAIAATHNCEVSDTTDTHYFFRNPAGDAVKGTVAAKTSMGGDITLIRFTSALDATLARYPVCTLPDIVAHRGKHFWALDQDLEIRLATCVNEMTSYNFTPYTEWYSGLFTSGSGRPGFIPLTDGTMIFVGGLWSTYTTSSPGWDKNAVPIDAVLDGYSESLSFLAIPNTGSPVAGNSVHRNLGVAVECEAGILSSVNGGITKTFD